MTHAIDWKHRPPGHTFNLITEWREWLAPRLGPAVFVTVLDTTVGPGRHSDFLSSAAIIAAGIKESIMHQAAIFGAESEDGSVGTWALVTVPHPGGNDAVAGELKKLFGTAEERRWRSINFPAHATTDTRIDTVTDSLDDLCARQGVSPHWLGIPRPSNSISALGFVSGMLVGGVTFCLR